MSHVDEGVLHAYLDGELTPVERARVDEHLAGCLACRTRLDEERQLIERAGMLLSAALPPERLAPPLSALVRPRDRRFWHVRLPLAWAATVILAIGLGWSLSQQLSTPEVKTLSGPIALRERDSLPAQQPAAPTVGGRLDLRRTRGYRGHPEPTLAQKSTARPDTNVADALTAVSKPAEEQRGAANAATRNLAPRMQAVARDEAPTALDSAAVRAILGREPILIPGLPVLGVRRSPRTAQEVVVAQALDSTHVILLFESRQTVVTRSLLSDQAVPAADARAPAAVAKAIPDSLPGRFVGGLLVEIQTSVTTDSVLKLLRRLH